MNLLGINAYHGDASAALMVDGELVAAVEEERFRRVKHWAGFPEASILSCFKTAGITPQQVDGFALSRNPQAHLARRLGLLLRRRPSRTWVAERLRNRQLFLGVADRLAMLLSLEPGWVRQRLHWVEHHPAHLASAFFASPFEKAAVCAIDGFGDFVSTSWAVGQGNRLQLLRRIFFPNSLGVLYLALTQYLGFPRYGDEYKVMGLAAYAQPEYLEALRRLVRFQPKGGFALELNYFRHASEGVSMTWVDTEPILGPVYTQALERLLGPARRPGEPMTPRHQAIAASVQVLFEELVFHSLNALRAKTRLTRLCLAGGCCMNAVANGKVREHTPFKEVYIQPAAADNGTSLGALLYVRHQKLKCPKDFVMGHAYWGPAFTEGQVDQSLRDYSVALGSNHCRVTRMSSTEMLCQWTAQWIAQGKVVGWFQGRMEWGARALGNRSILADPRRPDMRKTLNTRVKFREEFRPFAPSILEERVSEYFVGSAFDPFMTQVYPIRPDKRAVIPAVVHVDGSGRMHAVNRNANPLFWQLIRSFEEITGVPVLLNTSFNENEPIVNLPKEALDCFLRTQMDVLVLGHVAIERERAKE